MPEEYREYRNRRRPSQKSQSRPPKPGYIKKLLKQTLLSLLILMAILAPNLLGPGVSTKVKSIAKSALSYTVDTSKITKVLESLLKIPENRTNQGEPQNDETKNTEKNI